LPNVTGLLENDEDCEKFSENDEGAEGNGFVNVVGGLG